MVNLYVLVVAKNIEGENMTQRRCVKAEIYIYVPDKTETVNQRDFGYWLGRMPGRIRLFDENGERVIGKAIAFQDLGSLNNILFKQVRNMWKKRPKVIE